ncbi:MAG: EVE domain-containing protein [Gammaproteobacteria bacterium]|nr:EVE domain-containing protein [Gammaproteobacteria bacterium]
MQYWLFKSEPTTYSIDDLIASPQQTTSWEGVRNYQVRNFLRDDIKVGDKAFFYHSNCNPPGVAGIIEIVKSGYPDNTALDKKSKYFDPKSTTENPIWYQVKVRFIKKFSHIISLEDLKTFPELKHMQLTRKGNRLSISKVTESEWNFICSYYG